MLDDFDWNVTIEGQLLEAMIGHKPVGINKYFQMAFICDRFTDNCQKEINSDKIWKHLETMYNLEALDESEAIPFPNSEKDFVLPESDYGNLLMKKDEDKKQMQKGRETPKKEEKTIVNRNTKEMPRRDSKDSKEKMGNMKKDVKKELEKSKQWKSGKSVTTAKEEVKMKSKNEETPKHVKRPTRGSLKPDDSSSSGKSSPISVTPTNTKRRRI